jgi:hypothetical protein
VRGRHECLVGEGLGGRRRDGDDGDVGFDLGEQQNEDCVVGNVFGVGVD